MLSDQEIRSELIVPVVVEGETIAILNLERVVKGQYSDAMVMMVVDALKEAEPQIRSFRASAGSSGPLSDLTQEVLTYNAEPDFGRFPDFLGERMRSALHADKYVCWPKGGTRPWELNQLEWDNRAPGGILSLSDGRSVMYAPLRTYGDLKSIVGLVTRRAPAIEDLDNMEQVCRIAGEVIVMKRQEWHSRKFESLTRRILQHPDSATLYAVVTQLNEIVSADHCTLYGKVLIDEQAFLAVAASTSTKIYEKPGSEMFYRLGEPFDGLTGRVGTTGVPMLMANLSDTGHGLDIGAEWKRGMWEEGLADADIAAFYCQPIRSAFDGDIIGVLRLHRAKTQGQQGYFDPRMKERLEFVCEMLGHAYRKTGFFLGKYSIGKVNESYGHVAA